MRLTNRALVLAEAVKQSKAYLRKHAHTLPPPVVAQLKADLARNERELAELEAEKRATG